MQYLIIIQKRKKKKDFEYFNIDDHMIHEYSNMMPSIPGSFQRDEQTLISTRWLVMSREMKGRICISECKKF